VRPFRYNTGVRQTDTQTATRVTGRQIIPALAWSRSGHAVAAHVAINLSADLRVVEMMKVGS